VPYHPRGFADALLPGAVPLAVAATVVASPVVTVYEVDFGLGVSADKVCVEITLLWQDRIVDLGLPIDHVDHIVLVGVREGGSRAEGHKCAQDKMLDEHGNLTRFSCDFGKEPLRRLFDDALKDFNFESPGGRKPGIL
jgi:hypothetical protein